MGKRKSKCGNCISALSAVSSKVYSLRRYEKLQFIFSKLTRKLQRHYLGNWTGVLGKSNNNAFHSLTQTFTLLYNFKTVHAQHFEWYNLLWAANPDLIFLHDNKNFIIISLMKSLIYSITPCITHNNIYKTAILLITINLHLRVQWRSIRTLTLSNKYYY